MQFLVTSALIFGSTAITGIKEPPLVIPYGYSTPTPDGAHLFVMLAPSGWLNKLPEKYREESNRLAATYPKSGLYPKDGTTPLWTVDWFAFRVYPLADAIHLVRMYADSTLTAQYVASRLPKAEEKFQLESPGVGFYERGKLLRQYRVDELVTNPEDLKHSIKHVIWIAGEVLDRTGKKFVLNTQDQNQITFDAATGEILSRGKIGLASPRMPYILTATAIAMVLFAVALAWFVRRVKVSNP
ncbi:MAG TPA: hypothetical protein VGJ05_14160 [Fimbriiglobus sp.]|jgi:hypothetical protein